MHGGVGDQVEPARRRTRHGRPDGPGSGPAARNAVTPGRDLAHRRRPSSKRSSERLEDAPLHVRPLVLRARERDGVRMHGVPGARESRRCPRVRVPAHVVDVQVREEDEVDLVAARSRARRARRATRPRAPSVQSRETWRPEAGVDEDRPLAGPDEEGTARQAPVRPCEELRIERAIRLPLLGRDLGVELVELAERTDRVLNGRDLDRADYQRTRGGAGSPCASCQETPGSGARRCARSRPPSRRPA